MFSGIFMGPPRLDSGLGGHWADTVDVNDPAAWPGYRLLNFATSRA